MFIYQLSITNKTTTAIKDKSNSSNDIYFEKR